MQVYSKATAILAERAIVAPGQALGILGTLVHFRHLKIWIMAFPFKENIAKNATETTVGRPDVLSM
jgi:hypothetical protein